MLDLTVRGDTQTFALNICLGANADLVEDQAQPFLIIPFSNNKIEIVLNAKQRGPLRYTSRNNMKLFIATNRHPRFNAPSVLTSWYLPILNGPLMHPFVHYTCASRPFCLVCTANRPIDNE